MEFSFTICSISFKYWTLKLTTGLHLYICEHRGEVTVNILAPVHGDPQEVTCQKKGIYLASLCVCVRGEHTPGKWCQNEGAFPKIRYASSLLVSVTCCVTWSLTLITSCAFSMQIWREKDLLLVCPTKGAQWCQFIVNMSLCTLDGDQSVCKAASIPLSLVPRWTSGGVAYCAVHAITL